MKCKYRRKHYTKGYIKCERDGSIRKENKCRNCPNFKKRFIDKIFGY